MLTLISSQNIVDNIFIAGIGYVVVFFVLGLIYLIFSNFTLILDLMAKARLRAQGKADIAEKDTMSITGPESAAIATAIHMYFNEMHDEESNVITIKTISRRYSPWSSKLYNLREYPRR